MDGRTYFPEEKSQQDPWLIFRFYADPDYLIETLNMEMLLRRNFSHEMFTDSAAIIINETLMKELGWNDPIGRRIYEYAEHTMEYRIIGVVKDFHIQSLHEKIKPTIIHYLDQSPRLIILKLAPGNLQKKTELIEKQWDELNPDFPLDFTFLDQEIGKFYQKEKQLSRIVLGFTFFAILIALLGLFGLASYTAEQKTKEIAIRKVMGSNTSKISILLSIEFLKLILYSNIVAWPAAYFISKRWLQSFEYQSNIQFWVFIFAASFALFIGLLTVNIQTIRAALANPVKSLRYE